MGYLAGVTERIELVTAVLVLPQRQTALVAKQAAQVDLLSGGRVRLGVGTGWNTVEYEALGEDFHNRGKRQEEQVALMRELWAKDSVDFDGRWHRVDRASINPRPPRPTIPVWFGGGADPLLRRAAKIGDGWMPIVPPNDRAKAMVGALRGYLEDESRDPAGFGIQAQAQARGGNPDRWTQHADAWRELGATHIAIATMGAGFSRAEDHLEAAVRYLEAVR
jgi:probable F420-dependent oxidoreductase